MVVIAPPMAALAAVQDATRPWSEPLPKVPGVAETRRDCPQAMMEPMSPPAPGMIPTPVPMADPSSACGAISRNSPRLGRMRSMRAMVLVWCGIRAYTWRSTSAMPKRPTMTGMKEIPSMRAGEPNVSRG